MGWRDQPMASWSLVSRNGLAGVMKREPRWWVFKEITNMWRDWTMMRIHLTGKGWELSSSFVESDSFSSHVLGDFVSLVSSNVFGVIVQDFLVLGYKYKPCETCKICTYSIIQISYSNSFYFLATLTFIFLSATSFELNQEVKLLWYFARFISYHVRDTFDRLLMSLFFWYHQLADYICFKLRFCTCRFVWVAYS